MNIARYLLFLIDKHLLISNTASYCMSLFVLLTFWDQNKEKDNVNIYIPITHYAAQCLGLLFGFLFAVSHSTIHKPTSILIPLVCLCLTVVSIFMDVRSDDNVCILKDNGLVPYTFRINKVLSARSQYLLPSIS